MRLLAAETLTIGYGATIVASEIDFSVATGGVTCLLGPNGVGKTTLFKTVLGLIPPLAGTVRLAGDDIAGLARAAIARRIAFVPQSYAGTFAYTVLDLVVMGRTAHLGAFGTPTRVDFRRATEALEMLGIADLAQREAGRVSGGQRQLALIARALAQEASVIAMDEPTASLDLGNRSLVLDRIFSLAASGRAVLLSTHEPEHAFEVADAVAIIGRNPRFEVGPPRAILTSERLSALYGVPLRVERTPSGRHVVGREGDSVRADP